MVEDLVPDSLWERVAPLLPARAPRRRRFPGRLPVDDRVALAGVVYVLRTGITWNQLPAAVIGCSGVTCWRRMRDWTEAGVWPALHELLLAELRAAGLLDLDRMAVDASHVHALKGGPRRGPSPVNRGHPGSKHHLIVDGRGLPLAVTLTGGNRHDVTQLPLDAIPPIRGTRGRPRRKPRELYADRGYDFDKYRQLLCERGIAPRIARRGVAHGSGLGKIRWVVERGFAWLHAFKRLRTRYERRADIHLGLLQLACPLICHRQLAKSL
ncbi:IS5 family transposase [Pseudonocardia bannensis]|uniref:IS5 family transposase n=1 Tax=Pseudonocardia bannensis TaxID=630973 RepID=A0A848DRI6_9PSEU|nr:IS5 family transposase [Pseudonocardia bannensis]NMH95109.1 IS5 family transposase [Pseudonocardia bannensis]